MVLPSVFKVVSSDGRAAEFNWDKDLQSNVLGSFFYGYLSTQIIGGWISDRFGPKVGILLGIGTLSLGSVLSPVAARLDPICLMVIRIIQGIMSGFALPSIYGIVSLWSSPAERATLMSLAFCGISIANIICFPLSSLLCQSGIDGGWPMVFYVPGAGGLLWTIAFFLFAHTPETHPRISSDEKQHLLQTTPTSEDDEAVSAASTGPVPWVAMMTSKRMWGLIMAHVCSCWSFYLLAVNLPTFLTEALHMDIVQVGMASSLPYIGMFLMTVTGKLFDFLKVKNVLSFTNLRKVFNTIGFVVPAICMLLLSALQPTDWISHVALITVAWTMHEFALTGGFYFNHPDVAGPYKTVAFGITNTFAQLTGFINPMIIAKLTPDSSRDQWLLIFDIASGILIFGAICYILLGTTELEPWAKPKRLNKGEKEAARNQEQLEQEQMPLNKEEKV